MAAMTWTCSTSTTMATWLTLESFPGSGTNGEILDRTYTPASARHAGFRVRVVATGADGNGFDYWHIDTVRVVEAESAFIGTGTGLTGDYSNGDTSNETVPCTSNPDVTRIDPVIAFTNGDSGWPPAGIGGDTFSVRWTGEIQAQFTEDYTFHALHDDGVRVWVDGTLVIDQYSDQDDSWTDSGTPISLNRGQRYEIVIEYYENGGDEDMTLAWSSASTPFRTTVPQTQLYPTAGVSANLLAEWRMDESAWNGTSGEVVDQTGNGRDGTAQNGAQTDDATPALTGDPGTCGYGTFDGGNDHVDVAGLSGILNDTASLTFWIRTTQTGNDTGWQAPGVTGVEEAGGTDDIFWGWIDGSGRIGISVANDFDNEQKSSTAINDGTWHHVALTRDASSGETKVYVDGALESTGNSPTGTIGNTFSSLGRIEDTGGTPEYLDGDLDEVRVYDDVLTDSDVSSIFSDRHACALGGPVAWYQLDELAYDGSGGELADATGNGNNGTTLGDVTSYPDTDADAQVCSGAIVADNTSDGVIDALDTGVDVDGDLGSQGSINFWYWTDRRWGQLSDRMLFDGSNSGASGGPKYFYLALVDATMAGGPGNRGARLNFGLEDDDDDDFRLQTDRIDIGQETWVHIGVTWDLDNDSMEIYVNGSRVDSMSLGGSSDTLGDMETLYFGDNRGSYTPNPMNGNAADGRFDEIRLYDGVIDSSQMVADRDATHPCTGGGLDHYAIGHDGAAITCGEEQVSITAHDASDNAVDPGNTTVTLDTSTGEGTWARVIAGTGTLNDATAGDGAASYTFPGNGETSVTLAFNYTSVSAGTDPETVNFDVNGGNEATGEDPDLVVSRSGFRFTDGSGNPMSIPEQIAGKPSDANPGAITLALQAVRSSDSDPSVCEPYFSDGSDVEVELGGECNDPDTCAGEQVLVTNNGNTGAVVTSDDNGGTGAANYAPMILRFGTDSEAPLVLEYDDAGQIQLHARYNPIDDGSGTPPVVQYVTGASNPYVVRPFGFHVSVSGDDNTVGAGGTILAVAGDDVDTTVRSVGWQSADDADADGVPDAGADLSGNSATPNFGNETTPETVTLSPTVAAPGGGADGSLSSPVFSSFASGTETHGVSWNEVGHVHIDANLTDGSYFGGSDVTGRADTVGRFIPADFLVTVADNGDLAAACNALYTYTGQASGYAANMEPQLLITARNRGAGTTTNYRGDYAKLVAGDVSVAEPSEDASQVGDDGVNNVGVSATINTGTRVINGDGTVTYTFDGSDAFTYDRNANARIDGFTPDIDLDVTAVDDGEASAATPLPTAEPVATHEIRFGRLAIDAAAGSELAPIDQPVRAEYWNNGTWQTHVADDCTSLALASEVQLDNGATTVTGDQSIAVGGGTTDLASNTVDPVDLVAGRVMLTFAAPGAGNTGFADNHAHPVGERAVAARGLGRRRWGRRRPLRRQPGRPGDVRHLLGQPELDPFPAGAIGRRSDVAEPRNDGADSQEPDPYCRRNVCVVRAAGDGGRVRNRVDRTRADDRQRAGRRQRRLAGREPAGDLRRPAGDHRRTGHARQRSLAECADPQHHGHRFRNRPYQPL
ncbi:MAG: DUF6701 domain-containing protein [Halofilum sp. (in: g-proteobacteria)]|nr:DUF6701 domain-containing protein [Halofilum sp. (in: g-proteobacteria)]